MDEVYDVCRPVCLFTHSIGCGVATPKCCYQNLGITPIEGYQSAAVGSD